MSYAIGTPLPLPGAGISKEAAKLVELTPRNMVQAITEASIVFFIS